MAELMAQLRCNPSLSRSLNPLLPFAAIAKTSTKINEAMALLMMPSSRCEAWEATRATMMTPRVTSRENFNHFQAWTVSSPSLQSCLGGGKL